MSFYIKALGDWTKCLRAEFEKRVSKTETRPLEVWVRGPFGAPAQHVDGYERVILISGGIGATPFASVCKHVYFSTREMNGGVRGSEGSDVSSDEVSTVGEPLSFVEREVMRNVGNVYAHGGDFSGLQELEEEHKSIKSDYAMVQNMQADGPSGENKNDGADKQAEGKRGKKRAGGTWADTPLGSGDLSSPSSFAAQTLNIDDAVTASIVGRRAQIAPNVKVLRVLRSVMVNMVLCMVLVLRIALIAYVDLFYSSQRNGPLSLPGTRARMAWMTGLDLIMGSFMSVTIATTVAVELSVYGRSFLHSGGRIIDLTLLLPIVLLSNVMGVFMLSRDSDETMNLVLSVVHFVTVMSGLFVLLVYSLGRVIGSRLLLADRYKDTSFAMMRGVDFLWTTPTDEDDEWLRDELGDLANGKEMRLHRYVTRAAEDYVEHGLASEKGMMTHIG